MLERFFPCIVWLKSYSRGEFSSDATAALIVTIMLIPQSLAYAMLAGLPAEIGLYASILPLIAYALFGTSRTLAVGPVAVISLMTAATLGQLDIENDVDKITAAMALAFLSGGMLVLMGCLKMGFIANLLSHSVISGFVTASGIIIAASQFTHILGIRVEGHNLIDIVGSLFGTIASSNLPSIIIGVSVIIFLMWSRRSLKPILLNLGMPSSWAELLAKASPIIAVLISTLAVWVLGLDQAGVSIVGDIPQQLPVLQRPPVQIALLEQLWLPALLISIIGFVESVSIAETLAAKRLQRINPDKELIGLGAANVASSVSGGFPVTGGLSRSVVNFDAGAKTPLAGAIAALGIAIACLFLTPLIYYLPKATLAATIIVAVMSLVNLKIIGQTFRYSRSDFSAMIVTILLTLIHGVEAGLLAGVSLSLWLFFYRSNHPHSALVGRVPGTEHFRNIDRHQVECDPKLLMLRVDESLYFGNIRRFEDQVLSHISAHPHTEHFILMCPAVNFIDSSALERLESINHVLSLQGITFHLSEVKGPVMDGLKRSDFLSSITGKVFLSQYEAWCTLHGKDNR